MDDAHDEVQEGTSPRIPQDESKTTVDTSDDIPMAKLVPSLAPRPMTKRWIADSEVNLCEGCGLQFDWIRRKHRTSMPS